MAPLRPIGKPKSMPARRQSLILPLLVAAALSASGQSAVCAGPDSPAGPALVVPDDDLAYAVVNGHRIDFAANGAMVISRDGVVLCDVGLIYATPDWSGWGTQRRRSAPADGWERDPDDPMVLVHHGTLHHFDGDPRFKFVQRTRIGPSGLHLTYEVQPNPDVEVGMFGVAVFWPASRNAGSRVSLWPGFDSVALAAEPGQTGLLNGPGRGAFLGPLRSPTLEVVVEDGTWWSFLDDRQWDLNTCRLMAYEWRSRGALAEKQAGSFQVALRIAPQPSWVAPLGKDLRLEADPYGGAVLENANGPVAEIGFTWTEDARKWLRHRGLPQAAEQTEVAPGEHVATGTAWIAGATVSFEVLARRQDSGAVVDASVRNAGEQAPTAPVSWGLMVPADLLRGAPKLTAAEGASSAALTLTDGPTTVVECSNGWTLANETVGEREYYVLESTPTTGEDGSQEASVRLYAREETP
jgi:hypothetical protein